MNDAPAYDFTDLLRVAGVAADIALLIDEEGVIQDLGGAHATGEKCCDSLVGEHWSEIVAPDSRAKVEAILAEVRATARARAREVNQTCGGADATTTPYRFTAASVDDHHIMAFGRDLSEISRMQQQMLRTSQRSDRDYRILKGVELEYRHLFQISSEAVIIVEAQTLRVLEVNTSATRLLEGVRKPKGRPVSSLFDAKSRTALDAQLAVARSAGRARGVRVHIGPDGPEVDLAVSFFQQANTSHFLLHLHAPGEKQSSSERSDRLLEVLDALPEALVVLDEDMAILCANPRFCELVQLPNENAVIGQPLSRWLGHSNVDVKVLAENMAAHTEVRNLATVIVVDDGTSFDVTATGVAVPNPTDGNYYGVVLRSTTRQLKLADATAGAQARSTEQLESLVGQVPLKEIVRESVDLVERLCIESALRLTENNRASAANLLGLSRQGLYSKLRRHGLYDQDGDT